MASLYRRGKNKIWWIKYYVNGRAVYRSLNTTTTRVAARIKKQIEGEARYEGAISPGAEVLHGYVRAFQFFEFVEHTFSLFGEALGGAT